MATVTRKRFDRLSTAEKLRYVNAVKRMKIYDINIGPNGTLQSPAAGGTYQKFIIWHDTAAEHNTASFLPWHRVFLWEFEQDLIKSDTQLGNDGNIGIPYWKWQFSDGLPGSPRGELWSDNFMGGNGVPVTSGPFSGPDWRVYPGGLGGLERDIANGGRTLPTKNNAWDCQLLNTYDIPPFSRSIVAPNDPARSYRNVLEGFGRTIGSPGLHNNAHMWIGGHMSQVPIAPNDPVFYLNHCNVDFMWSNWQFMNPTNVAQYPSDPEIDTVGQNLSGFPRKRSDVMLPWNGSNGTRVWTIEKSLNFQKMGDHFSLHNYAYDANLGNLAFT